MNTVTPDEESFSRTMRIDLIPDTPSEPVAGPQKRVIITAASRRGRPGANRHGWNGARSQYQELLQGMYDAALIADLDGRIADTNVRASEFFLYAREELQALTIFDVISGADAELIRTLVQNLENERHTLIQAYCVRKDSSFFPAEIAVNKLNLDKMYLGFFIRDITLRRQAEEMLRTEHNAILNAGNGIAVVNLDGSVEYANPATERMWGCAADGLIGRDIRELFHERTAADAMLRDVAAAQGSWSGELRGRRLDGTEFEVQVSAARNRNADGETVGVVLSLVDISDRKRAEAALREAERQRVMLESLGAACHHIGQPATILLGSLELLQQKTADADPSVRQLVQAGLDSMRTLAAILQKLQAVGEYRTRTYLDPNEAGRGAESRILAI